jgi:hypothetical protein
MAHEYSDGSFFYGKIINGIEEGKGRYVDIHKNIYEGIWNKGTLTTNFGKIKYYNGMIYHGRLLEYSPDRKGIMQYTDGSLICGFFKEGLLNGKGVYYNKNMKKIYSGYWKSNLYHGNGTLYYNKLNNVLYQGYFKEGCFSGFGKFYHKNTRLAYKGYFDNGKFDGKGQLYDLKGELVLDGYWDHDIFIKKTYETDSDLVCIICYENKKNCIIRKCNHVITCYTCSKKIKKCPICSKKIYKIEKVFI